MWNTYTEGCCYLNKWKINTTAGLFDYWAEEERQDREKTQRRKTGHTDLKGFSPYITVRSTLQPPLERECLVNTSVLAFPLHFHWLHTKPSEVYVLNCKILGNEKRLLSPQTQRPAFISLLSLFTRAPADSWFLVPWNVFLQLAYNRRASFIRTNEILWWNSIAPIEILR